ncbi:hypothetical protein BV25DRAFT_1914431 [Artomyces pyxidatus]|uniref:Uncharacterized protein n=1 Tax=Artomyces pyxidatus TaxID=48021 RepID=A0ACB8T656_9AGAM|nr:hypothetical protein BV25DRAFT_1914431 [Artomyces pyxidatus]
MPVGSTSKRTATTAIKRPAGKTKPPPSADDLADKLAATLSISKGKHVQTNAKEEKRLLAMRAVNAASQGLSTVLKSGWKAPSGEPLETKVGAGAFEAVQLTTSAKGSLAELRILAPEDVDVERAALSVAGKLLSLDMHVHALDILADMHPHICAISGYFETKTSLPRPPPSKSRANSKKPSTWMDRRNLVSIPLPPHHLAIPDPTLLLLISTYLSHVVIAFSYTCLTSPSIDTTSLTQLIETLQHSSTLTTWMPLLAQLQSNHRDALLTRTYTALTKASAGLSSTYPQEMLSIRHYALKCLLLTSPATIEPNMFWDQVVKFGATFSRARPSVHTRKDAAVFAMSIFSDLVLRAEEREDREAFIDGKSFLYFCEYWLGHAKEVRDMKSIDHIANLMQTAQARSPSSPVSASEHDLAGAMAAMSVQDGDGLPSGPASNRRVGETPLPFTTLGIKLCASLAQTTALLENLDDFDGSDDDMSKRVHDTASTLERCRGLLVLHVNGDKVNEEYLRVRGKVGRALERLRRATIKVVDSPSSPGLSDMRKKIIKPILIKVASVLEAGLNKSSTADDYTSLLDALFVLARTHLVPSDPVAIDSAYAFLFRTTGILGLEIGVAAHEIAEEVAKPAAVNGETFANYLRCISGAFHTLGGSLYQAGKHGSAIRFLRPGCVLGRCALRYGRLSGLIPRSDKDDAVNQMDEKQDNAWGQLEAQLTRRWELLGVCYSKIGDRKLAYDAFIECIASYLYPTTLVQAIRTRGPHGIFQTTLALKQLEVIIDRVTYMAACELMRAPEEVSLRRIVDVISIDISGASLDDRTCIVGAIVERQIECLEGSLWKDGVPQAVSVLLSDALSVYEPETRPIRRAAVILKSLELSYYASKESIDLYGGNVLGSEELVDKIKSTLYAEAFGFDVALLPLRPRYQTAAHLWLALHAHRRQDPEQSSIIPHHIQEASRILKSFMIPTIDSSPKAKKSSPKQTTTARRGKERLAPVRSVPTSTRKQVPKTPRKAAAVPKHPRVSAASRQSLSKSRCDLDEGNGLATLVPLLRMAAQLAGLLGQTVLKVQLLRIIRFICEQSPDYSHDEHIRACSDLAHEYAKLGKVKKAAGLYNRALALIKSKQTSPEVQVLFLLRYTESLAFVGDVSQSEAMYSEAMGLSDSILVEDKSLSTAERVRTRANRLERAAMAASVYAEIQLSKDDPTSSITGLLQSLRLWHRAIGTISRLDPPISSGKTEPSNPFQVEASNKSSPSKQGSGSAVDFGSAAALSQPRSSMTGLEWQIAHGLLNTLLSLSHAYFSRGSAREAEYFAQQAESVAGALNAPAMLGRALAMKGEIQLHLGHLEEASKSLLSARQVLDKIPGPEAADVRRLDGEYNRLSSKEEDAQLLFAEAAAILEELDKIFTTLDGVAPRRSSLASKGAGEALVPSLLSAVLSQRIWLLRDDAGEEQVGSQAEQDSLMAKLTFYNAYDRFREDMFLSSLTESVISLPMGMTTDKSFTPSSSVHDILKTLLEAEKRFRSHLAASAHRGRVTVVREAASSLALIRSFQTSLGRQETEGPVLVANLLDVLAAITLRREMLEVVLNKFPKAELPDDLCWPVLSGTKSPVPSKSRKRPLLASPFDSDSEDTADSDDTALKLYWESIREKYQQQSFEFDNLAHSKADDLPDNWTIVHICVMEDKSSMLISRQRAKHAPLILCLPLKGRRESEGDEHLSFEDALTELHDIIRLSDDGTKQAANVKKHDQAARAAWWADRMALDKRMQELLESIEFCWLGAFKTVLSQPATLPVDAISDLRIRLDRIFKRSLVSQDKKQNTRIRLDDGLLECLSTLSPKCRDEELEDLVYFILDLYQFHGVQVAIAEVDVDHVAVELRTALEEHAAKMKSRVTPQEDSHMFLVLDKNVQAIPWESIPILRGRSVSRIPSIDFLADRLSFAKWRREHGCKASGLIHSVDEPVDGRAHLDVTSTYYVLNPSGDLVGTERRFAPWLKRMEAVGWEGVVGHIPSEQQMVDALSRKDLFIYFGHGGGEQYIRSHKIRHLPQCAATMLWGCSSGLLREMGSFDRTGTPYNYILAGCPTLVANLWDVTDRDIDKFSQAVFDKMHLTPNGVQRKATSAYVTSQETSIVAAIAESRDVCKLKYLTGAAPVIYGIPFYL